MIYLVGIGPGNPELLTVEALNIIKKADYILYVKGLYCEDFLKFSKAGCKAIPIVKFPLDKQIEFFNSHSESVIVRFHTGDLAYESGCRDLLDLLRENSIPFRCVPGISAVSACASRLGIDYLLDGCSNSFSVILPSDNRLVPMGQSIYDVVRSGGGMAVFGINSKNIRMVKNEFLASGKNFDSLICLCCRVSQADEKIVVTTLDKCVDALKKYHLDRFVILLAGDFLEAINPYVGVSLVDYWANEGIIIEL